MCLGEKNARSKEMIRQKAGEYMERAEKLKNHLADEEKKKKPRAMGANGKESGGGGKKYCLHEYLCISKGHLQRVRTDFECIQGQR